MNNIESGEKPIARSLCGWCGSGSHDICKKKDGYIKFGSGVHSGNQCKCHDLDHEYDVTRKETTAQTKSRRKTKR